MIAPRGLKGLAICDTQIGAVLGDQGFYHYRGTSALDLISKEVEEVWAWLLQVPLRSVLEAQRASQLNERGRILVKQLQDVPVLGAIQAAIAAIGDSRPLYDLSDEERAKAALSTVSLVPELIVARLSERRLDRREGLAAGYLEALSGEAPTQAQVRALTRYLVLTMDHGMNASTFTGRVVASAGASMAASLSSALGALSGPLHGGAPSRALEMIESIGDPRNARSWAQNELAAGRRLMGFGHAVYRAGDPRSTALRETACELGRALNTDLAERAVEIEKELLATLREHRPNATLVTNVEYYASVVLHLVGLQPSHFTPTFLLSRAIGWSAHILEQAADGAILRPSARYVGEVRPPAK